MKVLYVSSRDEDTRHWFREAAALTVGRVLNSMHMIEYPDGSLAVFRTVGGVGGATDALHRLQDLEFDQVIRHHYFMPAQADYVLDFLKCRVRPTRQDPPPPGTLPPIISSETP